MAKSRHSSIVELVSHTLSKQENAGIRTVTKLLGVKVLEGGGAVLAFPDITPYVSSTVL